MPRNATLILLILSTVNLAWGDTITTPQFSPVIYNVFSDQLVKRINGYHKNKYSVTKIESSRGTSLGRKTDLLEKGAISLIWASTSADLEKRFLPIRIPIFMGLMGYRIFIIHPSSQKLFDDLNKVDDLRQLTYGQGIHWSSTTVLEDNKLKVKKSLHSKHLFKMLTLKRFDAFPRGITQPWQEISILNLDLTVERHYAFFFHLPTYFFVNKNDKQLANDIEIAMKDFVKDGSLRESLLNDPTIADAIKKSNMKNRKILPLKNTTLSRETPLHIKEYWITLSDSEASPESL